MKSSNSTDIIFITIYILKWSAKKLSIQMQGASGSW
jgi:hypothetical protein